MRFLFLLFIFLLWENFSSAQDSLHAKVDSLPKEKIHSPTFAAAASAIIPGAGQVYNRKYWKVPIVYAGLATAGFFTWFNGNIYFTVRNNINSRVYIAHHRHPINSHPIPQPQFLVLNSIVSKKTVNLNAFNDEEMIQLEDVYRKYFTISIITGGVIYLLSILDAVVDAHLYQFDVSDDLSLNVQPQFFSSFNGRTAPGLSLSLSIK